jgi:hypothetical protein
VIILAKSVLKAAVLEILEGKCGVGTVEIFLKTQCGWRMPSHLYQRSEDKSTVGGNLWQ